jgi:hypothetical protein
MFLGGDYAGYWYDYVGGEAQAVTEFASEASVGVARSYFVALNGPKASKDTDSPLGFAGGYRGFGSQGSWKPILGDINVGYQYSISDDNAWKTYSLGASIAIGPSLGVFDTFSLGGEAHKGLTKLYPGVKQIKTLSRGLIDITTNLWSHSPLNIFSL